MVRSWASQGFVAVDWGSSARRAYVVDGDGRVVAEMEDAAGALTLDPDAYPAEVEALRARFGAERLLMAGMIGSNRGWREAPYVPCPATLPDIAAQLLWVEPGRTAIVPGLSLLDGERADVMRGEEVQVFGLATTGSARVCHPGTHTKWIDVEDGAITRFQTVMTGELFALIKRHSILADLLDAPAEAGPAFARGVEQGHAGGAIGAALFATRAGVLLGAAKREDAASFVSGLMIGNDLLTGLAGVATGTEIVVVGRGSLVSLYAAAIEHIGFDTRRVDGAQAFVAGMRALAEFIV
jgi:2-dehydro-3-deoxygalactonokinase